MIEPVANPGHQPVLLAEVLVQLQLQPAMSVIDCTFGGGGHSREMLRAIEPDGQLLVIDADPDAIERANRLRNASNAGDRMVIAHDNFAKLKQIASASRLSGVDAVLIDLGMSSFQLDTAERGFSFNRDGPLDMRFDPTTGPSAADLINTLPEKELTDLIWRFGEERQSRRIAAAIARQRQLQPITSTSDLAALIERAVGGRKGNAQHPATRTFQALRIAVNRELEIIPDTLNAGIELLRPGGRLAVIAFHSLEDRLVKTTFAAQSATCICPPEQPVCTCNQQPTVRLVSKAIKPGQVELAANPRSRSAILRVVEKVASP